MKTTAADRWFSLAVRQRAEWKCERCQKWHGPGRGLDCAHIIGRGKWATRHDPRNAIALCRGCHAYFTAQPNEFAEWLENRLGEVVLSELREMARDANLAKRAHHEEKEMATFYKNEYECGTCNSYFEGARDGADTGW